MSSSLIKIRRYELASLLLYLFASLSRTIKNAALGYRFYFHDAVVGPRPLRGAGSARVRVPRANLNGFRSYAGERGARQKRFACEARTKQTTVYAALKQELCARVEECLH